VNGDCCQGESDPAACFLGDLDDVSSIVRKRPERGVDLALKELDEPGLLSPTLAIRDQRRRQTLTLTTGHNRYPATVISGRRSGGGGGKCPTTTAQLTLESPVTRETPLLRSCSNLSRPPPRQPHARMPGSSQDLMPSALVTKRQKVTHRSRHCHSKSKPLSLRSHSAKLSMPPLLCTTAPFAPPYLLSLFCDHLHRSC